jgi:hypothetical protein
MNKIKAENGKIIIHTKDYDYYYTLNKLSFNESYDFYCFLFGDILFFLTDYKDINDNIEVVVLNINETNNYTIKVVDQFLLPDKLYQIKFSKTETDNSILNFDKGKNSFNLNIEIYDIIEMGEIKCLDIELIYSNNNNKNYVGNIFAGNCISKNNNNHFLYANILKAYDHISYSAYNEIYKIKNWDLGNKVFIISKEFYLFDYEHFHVPIYFNVETNIKNKPQLIYIDHLDICIFIRDNYTKKNKNIVSIYILYNINNTPIILKELPYKKDSEEIKVFLQIDTIEVLFSYILYFFLRQILHKKNIEYDKEKLLDKISDEIASNYDKYMFFNVSEHAYSILKKIESELQK